MTTRLDMWHPEEEMRACWEMLFVEITKVIIPDSKGGKSAWGACFHVGPMRSQATVTVLDMEGHTYSKVGIGHSQLRESWLLGSVENTAGSPALGHWGQDEDPCLSVLGLFLETKVGVVEVP